MIIQKCRYVRVVKETDSKSVGLCLRRFESCCRRNIFFFFFLSNFYFFFFFFCPSNFKVLKIDSIHHTRSWGQCSQFVHLKQFWNLIQYVLHGVGSGLNFWKLIQYSFKLLKIDWIHLQTFENWFNIYIVHEIGVSARRSYTSNSFEIWFNTSYFRFRHSPVNAPNLF